MVFLVFHIAPAAAQRKNMSCRSVPLPAVALTAPRSVLLNALASFSVLSSVVGDGPYHVGATSELRLRPRLILGTEVLRFDGADHASRAAASILPPSAFRRSVPWTRSSRPGSTSPAYLSSRAFADSPRPNAASQSLHRQATLHTEGRRRNLADAEARCIDVARGSTPPSS